MCVHMYNNNIVASGTPRTVPVNPMRAAVGDVGKEQRPEMQGLGIGG